MPRLPPSFKPWAGWTALCFTGLGLVAFPRAHAAYGAVQREYATDPSLQGRWFVSWGWIVAGVSAWTLVLLFFFVRPYL